MRKPSLRVVRWLLIILALLVAVGGGFAQFYIGYHLGTDVLAGYLIGASSACCAIGLLLRNGTRSQALHTTPMTPTGSVTTSHAPLLVSEYVMGSMEASCPIQVQQLKWE